MTATEILVLLGGLGLGYGVVAFVFGGKRQAGGGDATAAAPEAEAAWPVATPSDRPAAWHEVLGLAADAPVAEIRAAYRREIGLHHPDKVAALGPELQALAERKSRQINQAYQQALVERGEAL